jgi:CDP-diacylglycerol--glycerol-3-phosphate 3-phosphatidyltransferase
VGVPHGNVWMVVISLLGIIGTFLTSYTRARAEALGIDAKVGIMQRPERVTLLSAPQAFFGLALGGWVLAGIVTLLAVTAWITAVQRIAFVHRVTSSGPGGAPDARGPADASATPPGPAAQPGGTVPASRADGARHALT